MKKSKDALVKSMQTPSTEFVKNLEQRMKEIKTETSQTSEIVYIYDPEGNLIDKHQT